MTEIQSRPRDRSAWLLVIAGLFFGIAAAFIVVALVFARSTFSMPFARLFSGRVHHPPYPLQNAFIGALEETMLAAAGIIRPDETPLMHYAREVRVHIFAPSRVN